MTPLVILLFYFLLVWWYRIFRRPRGRPSVKKASDYVDDGELYVVPFIYHWGDMIFIYLVRIRTMTWRVCEAPPKSNPKLRSYLFFFSFLFFSFLRVCWYNVFRRPRGRPPMKKASDYVDDELCVVPFVCPRCDMIFMYLVRIRMMIWRVWGAQSGKGSLMLSWHDWFILWSSRSRPSGRAKSVLGASDDDSMSVKSMARCVMILCSIYYHFRCSPNVK